MKLRKRGSFESRGVVRGRNALAINPTASPDPAPPDRVTKADPVTVRAQGKM